jgi:hypothetical protein
VVEIVAFEQKRFTAFLRKRIGKAVAEIELRRVPAAFAEIAIRLARDTCLRFSHRFDRDLCGRQQFVEATTGNRIAGSVDDRGRFERPTFYTPPPRSLRQKPALRIRRAGSRSGPRYQRSPRQSVRAIKQVGMID